MAFRSVHTALHATVYRHDNRGMAVSRRRDLDPIVLRDEGTTGPGRGGVASLIGGTSSKNIGAAGGQWTLTLKQGSKQIQDEIQAGDWVVAWWSKNGKLSHGWMGRILNIRRAGTARSGVRVETFTLSGNDFGDVFVKSTFWFDEWGKFTDANAGGAFTTARGALRLDGAPDSVAVRLAHAMMGKGGPVGGMWTWPVGLDWMGEFFSQGLYAQLGEEDPKLLEIAYRAATVDGGSAGKLRGKPFNEVSLMNPNIGAQLDQMVREWANLLLNEVIYDFRPEYGIGSPERPYPVMVVRQKPFPDAITGVRGPWFRLPKTTVSREDLLNDDLTISDEERLNLYYIYPDYQGGMTEVDTYAMFNPLFDKEEIGRHGIRKYEQQTHFGNPGSNADPLQEAIEWQNLLVSWYALNHRYMSGQVALASLEPEIRVGTRFQIGEDGDPDSEEFYVEGVNHSWSYPGVGNTSLTLTRGWRGGANELLGTIGDAVKKHELMHVLSGEVGVQYGSREGEV